MIENIKISEKDIKDLIDFERRLEKKLGTHDPIDKEKYYFDIYINQRRLNE